MHLLALSGAPDGMKSLLPSLEMLGHSVSTAALVTAVLDAPAPPHDLLLVDATTDLGAASSVCRAAALAEGEQPVIVVVSEGALATLKATWGFDDWMLPTAQPAEIETRMRLALERTTEDAPRRAANIGDLSIDQETYIVRLRGRPLDLTYREFELLKFLADNPTRVFTRGQLLQEVWGYDYFGGTRTVDVHIRRLRAKLGAEYEQVISTVRGVGYKLDPQGAQQRGPDEGAGGVDDLDPSTAAGEPDDGP